MAKGNFWRDQRTYKLTKVGLNFNGNLGDEELVERARIAMKSGVNTIWIGEFEGFKDPFYVAELIADTVDIIGFGIISPLKRGCKGILKKLDEFIDIKGENVLVGLAPGKFEDPKEAIEETLDCVNYLKKHLRLPVLVGCSSPIITAKSSRIADGILFNYVKPEYIEWIRGYMGRRIFTAAYGPSLLLPSEFFESLLIASSIVISSERFVEQFAFQDLYEKIRKIDFERLIEIRHSGGDVENLPEFKILKKHSDVLLNNFTISGDVRSVTERICDLLEHCDHVILSDPFFRDISSMRLLKDIVEEVERRRM